MNENLPFPSFHAYMYTYCVCGQQIDYQNYLSYLHSCNECISSTFPRASISQSKKFISPLTPLLAMPSFIIGISKTSSLLHTSCTTLCALYEATTTPYCIKTYGPFSLGKISNTTCGQHYSRDSKEV